MSSVRVRQGPRCTCSCARAHRTQRRRWAATRLSVVLRNLIECRRVSSSGGSAVSASQVSPCPARLDGFAMRGRLSRCWLSSTGPIATTSSSCRRFLPPPTSTSYGCARSATSSSPPRQSSAAGRAAHARRDHGARCARRPRCCRPRASGRVFTFQETRSPGALRGCPSGVFRPRTDSRPLNCGDRSMTFGRARRFVASGLRVRPRRRRGGCGHSSAIVSTST